MINTAQGEPDSYYHPDYLNATWDDDRDPATPEVAWPDVQKRYATVVRRIDDGIGDLLSTLVDLKLDQNTLIVVTSDNGPSVESYLKENYSPQFFASFGPFDGIKRDLWEGGIKPGAVSVGRGPSPQAPAAVTGPRRCGTGYRRSLKPLVFSRQPVATAFRYCRC